MLSSQIFPCRGGHLSIFPLAHLFSVCNPSGKSEIIFTLISRERDSDLIKLQITRKAPDSRDWASNCQTEKLKIASSDFVETSSSSFCITLLPRSSNY